MTFIDWSESENVNVKTIDYQHKKLANLVNQLHQTLSESKKENSLMILKELTTHLKEHFDTEEKFMKEHKFVNYISHKLEHDRFLNKILEFETEIVSGNINVNLEILSLIKKWFFNHLELNDRKLGKYLYEKGVE